MSLVRFHRRIRIRIRRRRCRCRRENILPQTTGIATAHAVPVQQTEFGKPRVLPVAHETRPYHTRTDAIRIGSAVPVGVTRARSNGVFQCGILTHIPSGFGHGLNGDHRYGNGGSRGSSHLEYNEQNQTHARVSTPNQNE